MSNQPRAAFALPDWTPCPRPKSERMRGTLVDLDPLDADHHAQGLFEQFQRHDALWDFMPVGPFVDQAQFTAWLHGVQAKADPMFFAICDRASGHPVGLASYLWLDPGNGVIEVGNITLSPTLQRTPAATEAMHLMMAHAFGLGYRRYEWKCNALNLPSRRAAQRLGFSFEGVFRNHMVIKGRNRDTAWFSITDTDWPGILAAHRVWLDDQNFDANGVQRVSLADLTRDHLLMVDPALAR
ncbi:MAG: GNAT family protein [Gemmobacter sp.]|nr:GNAT family protein [Gemmobacter sp.]